MYVEVKQNAELTHTQRNISWSKNIIPVIDVNFLIAVYPSGQIDLSSWKYSESFTILPERQIQTPVSKKSNPMQTQTLIVTASTNRKLVGPQWVK